jgi:hypothetical protein
MLGINDREDKHYILRIQNLEQPIKSAIVQSITHDHIKIALKKEYKLQWPRLIAKKGQPIPSLDHSPMNPAAPKDPLSNIMSLMKTLYNSGGDEMQRDIQRAWAKAEEKYSK